MSAPKPQQPQEVLDLMAALKESLRVSRATPPEPESGSPEAVEPDIDDTYACACHCACCAPVEAEGERCPMCSEACGPGAVEQAPRHTPGPWERIGTTVYALVHAGWLRGVETFKNRFTAQISGDIECPREELEANAALIARASEIPDLERQRDELAERVRELEEEVEQELRGQVEISGAAGRAHEKSQARIAALEETNRELADALNGIVAAVQGVLQQRDRMRSGLEPSRYLPEARLDVLERSLEKAVEAINRATAPLPVEGEPEAPQAAGYPPEWDEDPCEFNPTAKRAALVGEAPHARAELLVGRHEPIRLCASCADRPQFAGLSRTPVLAARRVK